MQIAYSFQWTFSERFIKKKNEFMIMIQWKQTKPRLFVHINKYFWQFLDSDWSKPDHVGMY